MRPCCSEKGEQPHHWPSTCCTDADGNPMIKTALTAVLIFASLTACNRAPDASTAQTQAPTAAPVADTDPAAGNLAPAGQSTAASQPSQYSNSSQVAQNYPPATGYSSQNSNYSSYDVPPPDQNYPPDEGYDSWASNEQPIETDQPPPPLPEYNQPPIPGDNYYWTPGYWSYANSGYYWVPGAWVVAPWVDALWTPPYWSYEGRHYRWHSGYWGPHIGFYGGINYGFGYTGRGYYGAYWRNGALNYNRTVNNINPAVVHNVYNYSVPRNNDNRVSYNGGQGGINVRPTPQEIAVVHDPRTPPVSAQVQFARQSAANRAQFASAGHAQPASLVAEKPLATSYRAPAPRPPAAAMRAVAAPAAAPQAPAPVQGRPNEPQRQIQENRPGAIQPAPQQAPRPVPEMRQAPPPQQAQRPMPENRAAPQPAARPAPEVRPVPQQPMRPAPEARPIPQQQPARPAPQPIPQQQPARPVQQPEARPIPQQPMRPAPEARPAPQQQPARPAPSQTHGPFRSNRCDQRLKRVLFRSNNRPGQRPKRDRISSNLPTGA